MGFIVGCYYGEAATMRKSLQVSGNIVALGNVSFLVGVGLCGLVFWPLPLLHGTKPYSIVSLALMVPLQLPQAFLFHYIPLLDNVRANLCCHMWFACLFSEAPPALP
ncbi:hypothetical protein HOY82DRAFT_569544 [Tuber indicum]|nr:hypothetical protein HOY82DRAFT_569544 [Tuber indicum]